MSESNRHPGYSLEYLKNEVAESEKMEARGETPQRERPLLPKSIQGKLEILFLTLLTLGAGATAVSKLAEVVHEYVGAFDAKDPDAVLSPPTAEEFAEMDAVLEGALKELEIHVSHESEISSLAAAKQQP